MMILIMNTIRIIMIILFKYDYKIKKLKKIKKIKKIHKIKKIKITMRKETIIITR